MPKPTRTLLRQSVQIVIWALLIVALLGPHTAWSVCLTGKCRPSVEVADASCCSSCCAAERTDGSRGEGDGENGHSCPGCCIDLAIEIDEAPVPQPIRAPDLDHEVVAVLPEPIADTGSACAARYAGHDTGPPRVDRRTALIATTILRE